MLLNQLFQIYIPLAVLVTGSYVLIITPQHKQRRKKKHICQLLHPGASVQTATGLRGTAIIIMHSTTIIELATGQKIEILNQAITRIGHD